MGAWRCSLLHNRMQDGCLPKSSCVACGRLHVPWLWGVFNVGGYGMVQWAACACVQGGSTASSRALRHRRAACMALLVVPR